MPYLAVAGIGHGVGPVAPEFGARIVSARGARGHSGSFEPGTESLSNFAAIGVGACDSISRASGDGACHSGISGERGS
ncbi:hypothetical protein Sfulv_16690 [Streptomyces fulvorobeus]|uniref:Uncharacterized protein n=1 Tax=Streptomyces fulvorobeus TaxID=284028 RepID=A0A7J0C389_9ACTN|nr:hypothetical protein [Streptomyces fulvorobeus]GFM96858.1 hypothetical protein Sfulv_16690 [Streptomyces fulvorobeus]